MSSTGTSKPSELAITLATFPGKYSTADEWQCADEVRGRLALLGFACSTQQVGAWLARMARTDAPWVERRARDFYWEYRVTNYGRNDIDNKLPGIWWARDQMRNSLVLRARTAEGSVR